MTFVAAPIGTCEVNNGSLQPWQIMAGWIALALPALSVSAAKGVAASVCMFDVTLKIIPGLLTCWSTLLVCFPAFPL